ncbi:hypothetical protein ACFE04_013948 [Oxalis oulophora]
MTNSKKRHAAENQNEKERVKVAKSRSTTTEIMNILKDDLHSMTTATLKGIPEYTVKDAMKVLNAMNEIQKKSALGYFASTVIINKDKREYFMNLDDDDERLWWLQTRFEASKKSKS